MRTNACIKFRWLSSSSSQNKWTTRIDDYLDRNAKRDFFSVVHSPLSITILYIHVYIFIQYMEQQIKYTDVYSQTAAARQKTAKKLYI